MKWESSIKSILSQIQTKSKRKINKYKIHSSVSSFILLCFVECWFVLQKFDILLQTEEEADYITHRLNTKWHSWPHKCLLLLLLLLLRSNNEFRFRNKMKTVKRIPINIWKSFEETFFNMLICHSDALVH